MRHRFLPALALLASSLLSAPLSASPSALAAAPATGGDFRARLPEDEVVYFLLTDRFENGDPANDRGGLARPGAADDKRTVTGYDPTAKGFYHGGDLKGLIGRLDYIQGLGATALWVTPVLKNKPVQGPPGGESAGYHGYWITDFTRIDPHLGDDADFKALVDAAHARGMKVYLDIVINHTADVIQYRECPPGGHSADACPYRSRADYPYSRQGGIGGPAINAGFQGDQVGDDANFARLTNPAYAYTPYVPEAERTLKVPAWLNDPIYYHNRGNSTFKGESSLFGDFGGLDDLMTENPVVVRGFIDIYGALIDRYGIDGYRIDTARHVNPEFWQAFIPAMRERARARGIPNFHIFGEVASAHLDELARHTRSAAWPAVLDFGFQHAVADVIAGDKGTVALSTLFAADALYQNGPDAARQLPTFISNHDDGRLAYAVRKARPQADDGEVLRRMALADALLLTLRGVPVLYYGDEQGFAGGPGDQDIREDMFPTRVPEFAAQRHVGAPLAASVAGGFNPAHPLYRLTAELARLRQNHPALRRGRQSVLADSETPGLFAVSRRDDADGETLLIAFNTANAPLDAQVAVDPALTRFTGLRGVCRSEVTAPGTYHLTIPALDFVICAAGKSTP